MKAIVSDWDTLKEKLGGTVRPFKVAGDSRDSVIDSLRAGPLDQAEPRKRAFSWLAERMSTFVNVLRPQMRSLAADYQAKSE